MKIIKDITEFIFVENDIKEIKESDVIFIPGSSKYQLSELAGELYKQGLSKLLLPAGRYSSKNNKFAVENIKGTSYEGSYETDWEFCREVLIKNGVPQEAILKEDESTNTYENALFSKGILDKNNLQIKKAILVCQAFHARRVLMTYSVVFPNVDFYVCPIDTQGISKDNWFKNDYGIKRVLGEVEKCGKYFSGYLKELLIE
ncbi:YdcF family protein [Clostridium chromiireducens]|uniref:YdcF family protein n=1 Tax=Clostridium chromiireducens TaxID=225345 RepID=A0A399ISC3_9CLOT|nr:YdcF family protein [Clostridium chromiireducens]RII35487.1 YdcF family protein [Clostridium chromiireducens]